MTPSSIIRRKRIQSLYRQIREELGDYARYVNRNYFYERIRSVTGLSVRTIQKYLNQPP